LLNIKGANLNSFLVLNNILLFLIFICVKIYYFNTKYVVKNNYTQLIHFHLITYFKINNVWT